jgi:hypothetical protein
MNPKRVGKLGLSPVTFDNYRRDRSAPESLYLGVCCGCCGAHLGFSQTGSLRDGRWNTL